MLQQRIGKELAPGEFPYAGGIVAFKDAAKLRTWDAPPEDVKTEDGLSILDLEKRCVTMERLRALQPFDEEEILANIKKVLA